MWLAEQTLDNADGKQARHTGNSSTLGLVFDHGCDVLNTMLNTLTVLRIVGIHNYLLFALHSITLFTFFFTTLEE